MKQARHQKETPRSITKAKAEANNNPPPKDVELERNLAEGSKMRKHIQYQISKYRDVFRLIKDHPRFQWNKDELT